MKWYRILAVMRRHILQMKKDLAKIFDMLYWPLVDIIVWGYTSMWLQKTGAPSFNVGLVLVSALSLWGVTWRSSLDISLSFIEEVWSRNIVNLFSSPLTIKEWITAVMILGFTRSLGVFLYTVFIVWLFYGWNVLSLGIVLIPFFILLMISGWAIGFFVAAFLVYSGRRFQSFIWSIGWLFSILGAVFYPVQVLPPWLQAISYALPISYVFESMRTYIQTGTIAYTYLGIAAVLNVVYISGALVFFKYMFNKSKQYGLALLEVD